MLDFGSKNKKFYEEALKGVIFLRALDLIAKLKKMDHIQTDINHLKSKNKVLYSMLCIYFKKNLIDISEISKEMIDTVLNEYIDNIEFLKNIAILNQVLFEKKFHLYSIMFFKNISLFFEKTIDTFFIENCFFYNVIFNFLYFLKKDNYSANFVENMKICMISFTYYLEYMKKVHKANHIHVKICLKLLEETQKYLKRNEIMVSLLQLSIDDFSKNHQNIFETTEFIKLIDKIDLECKLFYENNYKQLPLSGTKYDHLKSSEKIVYSTILLE